ncbi:cbb3-type cytochrome c oxidase subunit 3 [Marinobacterium sp. CAU 1594]|nr:cbb3-type cytochrome c oxidase subunit 3 [Marinobacterium arenosum]MBY4677814.1 cbb3-type cytochrome c oxidase subunit 3 [Marinobacterium arenosum]
MLITFLGLFAWVLMPGNKKRFDDAANLPFADDGKTEGQETDNGRIEK